MNAGGCLCGAVRYHVEGPLDPVTACHCAQCRRASGNVAAYTAAPRASVTIRGPVAWFDSTPGVIRRGFCRTCGSQLFWDRIAATKLAISAGGFDSPTGLALVEHIYVEDKGDYYEIADDLPRHAGNSEDLA